MPFVSLLQSTFVLFALNVLLEPGIRGGIGTRGEVIRLIERLQGDKEEGKDVYREWFLQLDRSGKQEPKVLLLRTVQW